MFYGTGHRSHTYPVEVDCSRCISMQKVTTTRVNAAGTNLAGRLTRPNGQVMKVGQLDKPAMSTDVLMLTFTANTFAATTK
jgi:hypothetical protein